MRKRSLGTGLLGLAVLAVLTVPACTNLPNLQAATCGNLLVEGREDCDGPTADGTRCAAPGAPNACRYLCGAGAGDCPAGWGCGTDGVCRSPDAAHDFTLQGVAEVSARILAPADFDGDGKPALLALSDDNASGSRTARILDPDVQPLDTGITIPLPMAQPTVGDLNGDGLQDVAFVDPSGVVVLEGTTTHTPRFFAYPSVLSSGHPHFRGIPMEIDAAAPGDEIVVFIDDNKGHIGLYPYGNVTSPLLDLGYTGKKEPDLAGITRAALDAKAGCDQILVAFTGLSFVVESTPCSGGGWATSTTPSNLQLPAPVASPDAVGEDNVVRAVDVDGDQKIDLLIATQADASSPVVVQLLPGKNDGTFGPATPWTPAWNGTPGSTALPLAAADIDKDATLDFVFPEGIALRRAMGLELVEPGLGAWSEAVIGDFDKSGLLEILASSYTQTGLEVVSRNPTSGLFGRAEIPTAAPAQSLAVGDYDGDLIPDVAFAAISASGATWNVTFGAAAGTPSPPVTMAQFDYIDEIVSANLADGAGAVDDLSDLVLIPEYKPGTADETDTFVKSLGRADRIMVAPFTLTRGSGTPDLPMSVATGLIAGPSGGLQLAALGADPTGALRVWEFVPAQTASLQPVVTSSQLASSASGFHLSTFEGNSGVNLRYGGHVATGDLDGDGADEVVLSAPYADRSAIVIVDRNGSSLSLGSPIVLPGAATLYNLLRVADVDGDGAKDILFKAEDDTPQDVAILWNDGKGRFSASSKTVLHTSEGIVDFACVRGDRPCLLYVIGPRTNKDGSAGHAARITWTSRSAYTTTPVAYVDASGKAGKVPGGDALVAADVDGDGLDDLAVANDDGVSLFHANANHP